MLLWKSAVHRSPACASRVSIEIGAVCLALWAPSLELLQSIR